MGFQFRLKAVLAIRLRERELKQRSVAVARADLAKQLMNRDRLHGVRITAMSELRMMNDGANWNADQAIVRQRHVDQLANELVAAEAAIAKGQMDLQECLAQLLAADQSVRMLEKLQDKRSAEYEEFLAKSNSIC
jgi:hypothetical protein